MTLKKRVQNAKKVLANGKTRVIVLSVAVIALVALVLGVIKIRRSTLVSQVVPSAINATVPNIKSIPGMSNPTREYAQLQEQQNEQLAREALAEGKVALPTMVRSTYIDSAVSGDQAGRVSNDGCDVEELVRALRAGVQASELRCRGCSIDALKAAGFSAAELMRAGFSAADLKKAGFSAEDLFAAGYSAADLLAAGYSLEDLVAAGYSAADLMKAGFSAADLKKAGFSAEDLKKAGFSAKDLLAAGFSAADLKKAGFSAGELLKAGISTDELLKAGFSAAEIAEAKSQTLQEYDKCDVKSLQKARMQGVSAEELRKLGCDVESLRIAGFTADELKKAGFSAGELAKAGFSAAALRAAGFDAKELKDAGFSAEDLKKAGFAVKDLLAAGFNAADLKKAGFSAADLKKAGVSAKDLKAAGFSASDLIKAGFGADELMEAGFSKGDLLRAGSLADLIKAGFSAEDLMKAGFGAEELLKAGFSAKDLKKAGFSAKDLMKAGVSAEDLLKAGFDPEELLEAGFSEAALLRAGLSKNDLARLKQNNGRTTSKNKAAVCQVSEVLKLHKNKVPAEEIMRRLGCTRDELAALGIFREGGTGSEAGYDKCSPAALTLMRRNNVSAETLAECGIEALREAGFSEEELKKLASTEDQKMMASLLADEGRSAHENLQRELGMLTENSTQSLSGIDRENQIKNLQATMTNQANQLFSAWTPAGNQEYIKGTAEEGGTVGRGGAVGGTQEEQEEEERTGTTYKAGTIFFVSLDSAVNSDENVPVMATIVTGSYKGAKVLGNFQRVDRKVVLQFSVLSLSHLVNSISFSAVAIDAETARAALASGVDNHYMLRFGSLMATSFLEGLGEAFEDSGQSIQTTTTGTVVTNPALNLSEKLLVAMGNMARRVAAENSGTFNTPPTVTVDAGTSLGLLLTADLFVPDKD